MRRALLPLLALALLAMSCGDDRSDGGVAALDVVPVADRARPSPDDDPRIAGEPMLDLGVRLLAELADGSNTLISPASIAVALAMVEPGAVGEAQAQLREVLGITDAAQFHAAMNALEQSLETRVPTDSGDGAGAELVVPRFETRASASLAPALRALGLTAPFEEGHLLGIADDPQLVVTDVVHQAWLAMDEQGTEAAAATAVVMGTVSAPAGEPVPVVLDRPFLFRIFDPRTGATLFLGQVLDPTA